jgi:ferrochelatase
MRALLLLAFGGPRSLDEVELLLTRLFGRKPSPEQLEGVKERYRLIGGSSPLPAITEKQARAIEERLNDKGYSFKSYVAMRYCLPSVEETIKEILQDGAEEVIALPMAPFRSRFSTGAYQEELNRANKAFGDRLKVTFIEEWHSNPLFLDAIAERVREGLSQFTPDERERVHLIFSAHSLPESIIKSDPYVDDFRESAEGILERVGSFHWHMAFQSKGRGPEKWIGPDVESVLTELGKINVQRVLVAPVGFVSDHIEILYDIDILYRKKAEALGMILKRTPSLNSSEGFIEALTTIVEEHITSE